MMVGPAKTKSERVSLLEGVREHWHSLSRFQRMLCAATPAAWLVWRAVVEDPQFCARAGFRHILRQTISLDAVAVFFVALLTVVLLLITGYRRRKPFDWLLAALPGLALSLGSLSLVSRFPLTIPLLSYVFPGIAIIAATAFLLNDPVRRVTGRLAESHQLPLLCCVLAVAFSAAAARLLTGNGFKSGDEGHYLVQTVSLLQDGDLDLANNLGKDFAFTEECFSHFHISHASTENEAHSHHPFGLSLMMLPGYALGGVWGASVVLILIGIAHGLTLYYVIRNEVSGVSPNLATGVTLIFCLSLPLLIYGVRAYPEMAAGWLYLAIYHLFGRSSRPTAQTCLLAGICLGFLPWLLIRRYYVPFIVLNSVGVWHIIKARRHRDLIYLLLPQALLFAALLFINQARFAGNTLFAGFDGSGVTGGQESLSGRLVHHLTTLTWLRPRGLLAVFVDKRFGLIWSGLWMVLLFPAAIWTGILRLRRDWPWVVMVLGLYGMTCANIYAAWTAGTAAHPPRYLVAVLPFLAIPLARLIGARPRLLEGGGFQVSLACALMALVALFNVPHCFTCPYEAYTRVFPAMSHLTDALPWFRSWFYTGPTEWPQALVLATILLLLSVATFSPLAPRITKGYFCLLLMLGLMISSLV